MKVFVTGSTSGLGRDICEELEERGHTVLRHARSSDADFVADFAENWDVEKFHKFLHDNRPDAFILNAGDYLKGELHSCAPLTIARLVNVNLTSQLLLLSAIVSHLRQLDQSARVIIVNSVAALSPSIGESVYAATKAGLRAASEALQLEVLNYGIEISTFFPGGIATRMTREREDYDYLMGSKSVAKIMVDSLSNSDFYQPHIVLRRPLRRKN